MQRFLIVVTAMLPLVQAASACERLESEESPLETRRPVLGDEARLAAGFGLRTHPILAIQRMHTGVDWAAPLGTSVIAAGRGRVSSAGREGEYGNRIIIDHGGQWQTFYSQLDRFSVQEGDCVDVGTVIGAVGTTGLSTGPHLHFEVRRNGQPLDPMVVSTKQPAR